MRLYQARVAPIASEIVRRLTSATDIETENTKEVEADVASVLESYIQSERDILTETKDIMAERSLGQHEFSRIRKLVADRKGIAVGEDALDYLLDQLVAILMHSDHVTEVFSEDVELRRKMAPILKKEDELEKDLDIQTRSRLRNVQEGSRTWEVEYRKVMDEVRRRKGL